MKTKTLITIICLITLSSTAQQHSSFARVTIPRQVPRQVFNSAPVYVSPPIPVAVDPEYKAVTNKIAVLCKIADNNRSELVLLRNAKQGESSRGKQLTMWLDNEGKEINRLVAERDAITSKLKLKEFYKQHPERVSN